MTLIDLITKADEGYRKGFSDEDGRNPLSSLLEFVDENGKPNDEAGDSLATFIVREIYETYEPDEDDEDQIDAAVNVLARGLRDLENTIAALGDIR